MSKELDEKLSEVLNRFLTEVHCYLPEAIAEIKAAILEHAVPKVIAINERNDWAEGYNQAVTEITEKLK